jgi:SAM-dependent methyltransferase
MVRTAPYETHVAEYDGWFERYPHVFQSEVEAIRDFLPPGNSRGLQVEIRTGHYAQALGIKEGTESVSSMRNIAISKGYEVMDAQPEALPYKDLAFDFVLMNFCISYFDNVKEAFREAHRILKPSGVLIVGFVDRSSPLGLEYEEKRNTNTFYQYANFYEPETVINWLKAAGFSSVKPTQTLFQPLDKIKDTELAKPGYGEGSYVIIGAFKK